MNPDLLEALPAKEYLQHFHLDYYISEALRSCDSPDQLPYFFQEVLDGSRVKVKAQNLRMVLATPENRCAFVELMRTQLSLVAPKPKAVALTVLDFYDMVVLLLPDFPVDFIIEASDFAPRVMDGTSHHLLGQQPPDHGGISAALANGEVLFSMHDLQRMVEFRLVYGEVLEAASSYRGRSEGSSRYDLVKTLRSQVHASLRSCGPSEGAWQRLLCGQNGSILTCKQENLNFIEAVREMAECFELVLSPVPEVLKVVPPEESKAQAVLASSAPAEMATAEPVEGIPEISWKADRSPLRDRRSGGQLRIAERGSLLRSRSRA